MYIRQLTNELTYLPSAVCCSRSRSKVRKSRDIAVIQALSVNCYSSGNFCRRIIHGTQKRGITLKFIGNSAGAWVIALRCLSDGR